MRCLEFKKNFRIFKNTNFITGIKEIKKLVPNMIPTTIGYAIISSITPFISIYGISIILDEIANNNTCVVIHMIIFLTIQSLCCFTQNILHRSFFNNRRVLFLKEKEQITNVIINLKKSNIYNYKIKSLCNKENSIMKHQSNNPLFMICKLLFDAISGITTIGLTFTIVSSLFVIYDNQIFLTSKFFSLLIILFTLLMIVLVGVISAVISKKASTTNEDLMNSLKKFDYYWDYFNDFETGKSVRIFHGKKFIVNALKNEINNTTFKILDKKGNLFAKQGAIIAFLGSILAFFLYLIIGFKCYWGLFTIGYLTRYLSGFMQIVQGGMLIANGIGQIIYLNNNLKYYCELMQLNTDTNDEDQIDSCCINKIDSIEFKNVYYKYDNAKDWALENINLSINQSQVIAVVGENGAGKTTFIQLLLGIYEPTLGNIFINGINMKNINKSNYLMHFSTMFQDFFLPGFSISEVISGGEKRDYNPRVISAAGCNDFLKNFDLDNTYLTNEYNVRGIDFSGGEKQKIAFARALNKDCDFYLFDEPSSAMDAISEYNFYHGLNKYLENKKVLYISHRLFSCVYAERIIVFGKGRILEDDTFERLRGNKESEFNKLWCKQSDQYLWRKCK